jgi:hypothetical protein
MLRERVGQLKTGIDLAIAATVAKHTIIEPVPETADTGSGGE